METKSSSNRTMKNVRLCPLPATHMSSVKNSADSAVPTSMKGMRLPMGVSTRSEIVPNSGNRNRASILSRDMMTPVQVSPRSKW